MNLIYKFLFMLVSGWCMHSIN